jgi:hypothetical protein
MGGIDPSQMQSITIFIQISVEWEECQEWEEWEECQEWEDLVECQEWEDLVECQEWEVLAECQEWEDIKVNKRDNNKRKVIMSMSMVLDVTMSMVKFKLKKSKLLQRMRDKLKVRESNDLLG